MVHETPQSTQEVTGGGFVLQIGSDQPFELIQQQDPYEPGRTQVIQQEFDVLSHNFRCPPPAWRGRHAILPFRGFA